LAYDPRVGVVINSTRFVDCAVCILLVASAAPSVAGQALFPGPPVPVACPGNGGDFHVADLNGNGMADAIVGFTLPDLATPTTRGIVTLLDIASSPSAATQTFITSSQIIDIATGDWNRDGTLDVLLAPAVGADLLMLPGGTGGLLQPPVVIPFGAASSSIHPADFDGDGNLDVLANHGWSVSAHLGDGAGGFSSAVFTAICPTPSMGVCVFPPAVQLDDLDQDGFLDLVVLFGGLPLFPPNLSIYRGDGSGSFTFLVNTTFATTIWQSLVVRDLNGDTIPDILTAGFTSTLEFIPGVGGGAFGQKVTIPVPNPTPGVNSYNGNITGYPATGDLNGDGFPDVVYPGRAVMLNDGAGGFVLNEIVPATQPGRVAIADLDQDLQQDLVFWTAYWPFPPPVGLSLFHNVTPCAASGYEYGLGCRGSGGYVPSLSARGCATPGGLLTLSVEEALGGSPSAALVVGPGPTNVQIGNGCGILTQLAGSFVVPFALGGLPVPGQGRAALSFVIPPGITPGTGVALQAVVLDPASPFQWAASNGVALTIQ
jgi:hypothetical protein